MPSSKFLLPLCALVSLSACSGDSGPTVNTPFSEARCENGTDLTWETFGEPFMRDYCTSCHGSDLFGGAREGAPVDANFDDLDTVREFTAGVFERSAADNTTMPPENGPSLEERALLAEWLACGAPAEDDAL